MGKTYLITIGPNIFSITRHVDGMALQWRNYVLADATINRFRRVNASRLRYLYHTSFGLPVYELKV